jgi:hypothetical protein
MSICLVRVYAVSLTPRPLMRRGEGLVCPHIQSCTVNGIVFRKHASFGALNGSFDTPYHQYHSTLFIVQIMNTLLTW